MFHYNRYVSAILLQRPGSGDPIGPDLSEKNPHSRDECGETGKEFILVANTEGGQGTRVLSTIFDITTMAPRFYRGKTKAGARSICN
jgi:hypothetical protein